MSDPDLRAFVRDVPDFPRPGILFRDVTPLLADPAALREAVQQLAAPFREARIERVVGVESRGFLLGAPVALELGAGLAIARKPGKLPRRTVSVSYTLEYGTAVPGRGYIGLEEDVLVTGDGVEWLSTPQRALWVVS